MSDTYTITSSDQRVQLAADKDAARYPGMRGVHFNERFAVATTGRIMAVRLKTSTIHHTTVDFKRAKQTNTRHLKNAVQYNRLAPDHEQLKSEDDKNTATINDGRFPQWQDVVPTRYDKPTMCVSLDAALLLQLAKAISDDGENTKVTLEFVPNDTEGRHPILVANCGRESFGVIMPISSETKPQEVVNHVMRTNPK